MMRTAKPILSATVAVAIVALSGCGGGSSSSSTAGSDQAASFKAGYEPATAELKQTAVAVAGALKSASSQSNAQINSTFSRLASQWQGESAKLGALNPPSAVSSNFEALRSSSVRVETDLNALAAAAAGNDAAAAKRASVGAITDILAAKSASTKVQSALGSQQ